MTIAPDIAAWFAKLPAEHQAALQAKWADLQTHPDIAHGHRNADYARRTMLREFIERGFK